MVDTASNLKDIESKYNIKDIFKDIELDMIRSLKNNLSLHIAEEKTEGFDWPQWQALKLKKLKNFREENKLIYESYEKVTIPKTILDLRKQYKEGKTKVNKEAIKSGVITKEDSQLSGSFFGLNDRKLNALVKSTKNDLTDVKTSTLRKINDVYRSTIYKAQVYANSGVKTVSKAIDMATREFLEKGIKTIIYKDGSIHSITDYVDMYVRSANKRANLMRRRYNARWNWCYHSLYKQAF